MRRDVSHGGITKLATQYGGSLAQTADSFTVRQETIGASAPEAPTVAFDANRLGCEIKLVSGATAAMYIGHDLNLTSSNGFGLAKAESLWLPTNADIFLRAQSGSQTVQIVEYFKNAA